MVARRRNLRAGYQALRHRRDPLFLSHFFQTLVNKFNKKGKKPLAKHLLVSLFAHMRIYLTRVPVAVTLAQLTYAFRLQLALVARRKGKKILQIPTPVARNKRQILNTQFLVKVLLDGKGHGLSGILQRNLSDLILPSGRARALLAFDKVYEELHENRVWFDKR